MNTYVYDGPVMKFNTVIATNWHSETTAVSESKARSNMVYKFKKGANLVPKTDISLPGKIKLVQ